ncbi:alpha/beta fold hydrolase [Micromonospora sp. 4G55]|uniref:alpha/beta fold hydrolase n=1 Tax=Micromonospora sp. 4G55 TaxID=2806102 RepID=UPI001A626270|nr:alpha/beta fold hydrolase [Micromonospora sp. 4G55]MBM0260637.1 alpha/beta fold hydrolase [Micromonospora sp. 4G55]
MTDATLAVGTVRSADGTTIAYERSGDGPAIVLVGGAFNDRTTTRAVAAALAADFTVFGYDRRGRGDSGDTAPYTVQREIEDLAALIGAAGGAAYLYGISSGAILAALATAAGSRSPGWPSSSRRSGSGRTTGRARRSRPGWPSW